MKKILALVFLVASSATAHADWVKIDSPVAGANLYLDNSAAEKSAAESDQALAHRRLRNGTAIRSQAVPLDQGEYEYNCNDQRFRELIRILHKEPIGNGMTVYWTHGLWSMTHDPSLWIQPETNSVEAASIAAVCTGQGGRLRSQ